MSDFRRQTPNEVLLERLVSQGIPFFPQHIPIRAEYHKNLKGIWIESLKTSQRTYLDTDLVFASTGRVGRWKLLRAAGVSITYNPAGNTYVCKKMPEGYFAAGRVLGASGTHEVCIQGRLASAQALASLGLDTHKEIRELTQELKEQKPGEEMDGRPAKWSDAGKAFVCFCHDVTVKDVVAAKKEGFNEIESAKRYTTATMGQCQGAMCLSEFVPQVTHNSVETRSEFPLPTPRPPSAPISLGAFAGAHIDQPRLPPLHAIQVSHGGRIVRTGPWIRIDHFGDPDGECLAVHKTAGLADVSTLGKFRVFGPNASDLLDRIYIRNIRGLDGDHILYSPACNEEGVIFDDGIIVLRETDEYYVTSSTARAPMMREWFERWIREEKWKVWITELTDNLCAMNLAGPKSRSILSKVVEEDISNRSLPYMKWIRARICGIEGMIFRMGFLGELSYEIHIPSSYGPYVWERLIEEGKPEGLKPVGLETQFVCRLEKGHAIPGLDIDGNTTLFEAGFGWAWEEAKAETVVGGPVLSHLKDKPYRQRVIGFVLNNKVPIKEGYLVVKGQRKLGHVTSARYSPLLEKVIGLALVRVDQDTFKQGTVTIYGDDNRYQAEVVNAPFYDPEGQRLRI